MKEQKFERYMVSARKDLLHFVEESLTSKVYEGIGRKPKEWIEELNLIQNMLNGESLCAGIDTHMPPKDDLEFKKLGDNAFLYRGGKLNLTGLWFPKETKRYDYKSKKELPHTQWTHYKMGRSAVLSIIPEFDRIKEAFLPENFEKTSKVVKDNKRPILCFNIPRNGKEIKVYAKGSYINFSCLYEPPSYRLTNLADIMKITSKKEMEITLELADNGIKCPEVLGYYEALAEDFLFSINVDGKNPSEFLNTHRKEIIEQDAQMLAILCLKGYRKTGFTDYDDKIFDGKDLYLIDVDELTDLYYPYRFDFRKMLINPSDTASLKEFREMQKSIFKQTLKDAIFRYKNSLTPILEDKVLYIKKFYEKTGYNTPAESEIKELTTFPEDYTTFDTYISMMSEE